MKAKSMLTFLVVITFFFHTQQPNEVKFRVPAHDAERAAHIAFRLAQDLACLYDNKVTRCVGPGSVGVSVTEVH